MQQNNVIYTRRLPSQTGGGGRAGIVIRDSPNIFAFHSEDYIRKLMWYYLNQHIPVKHFSAGMNQHILTQTAFLPSHQSTARAPEEEITVSHLSKNHTFPCQQLLN